MIAEPLCLYDFCQETDGAVAVITTSIDRARDLKQKPVTLVAVANGGTRDWGRAFGWFGMPDETLASSGNKTTAEPLYKPARLTSQATASALTYELFTKRARHECRERTWTYGEI